MPNIHRDEADEANNDCCFEALFHGMCKKREKTLFFHLPLFLHSERK